MSVEIKNYAECNDCKLEAIEAYCDKHFEAVRSVAFEEGRKQGYEDGFEKGKSEPKDD